MSPSSRLQQLRSTSPREAARLVFRKAIYRRVEMRRYGTPAGESVAPTRPLELPIEILGPGEYERVLGTTPYLSAADLEHFQRQESRCIVVATDDEVAACSWMTWGDVYVSELQRTIRVPEGEHFSCRSFVHPAHQGQSLMSHMIHHYSTTVAPTDLVWGLVYAWNTASVRSLERIGWRHRGDYWTTWIFDRQLGGQRLFTPPAATDAS
jgi:GNAT superfamily N-acetyltransferase